MSTSQFVVPSREDISHFSQINARLCHPWDDDGRNDDSNSSNTVAVAMMMMMMIASVTTMMTMAAGTESNDNNQLKAAVACPSYHIVIGEIQNQQS